MIVVFSILHYQDSAVTKDCVESIMRLRCPSSIKRRIVIVDNCSPNGSGVQLESLYKNSEDVFLLLNKCNSGFAKGNNYGYSFSVNELKADVVIVMNNDIVIEQDDFLFTLERVIKEYSSIAVFSPDIVNRLGKHQNPYRNKRLSILKTIVLWGISLVYYLFLHTPLLNRFFVFVLEQKKRIFISKRQKDLVKEYLYGIVPHGAAIIYGPAYLQSESEAFDNRTFLYAEEDLLMEMITKKRLQTIFVPNLRIKHLEDVATDSITKSSLNKKLFMSKHKLYSTTVLLRERIKNI